MTERCIYLSLLLVTGDVGPYPTTPVAAAQEIAALVDAGDLEALPHRLSDDAAHASAKKLQNTAADIHATFSRSTRISTIEATRTEGTFEVATQYGEWTMVLAVARDGTIDHLELEPGEPPLERSAPLHLPVRGEWRVNHGGSTPELNHHAVHRDQRRAADLAVVDSTGSTYRGEGKRNEDYYAYGRDIVAMTDGIVFVTVDGVVENVPRNPQGAFGPGNMVLLAHPDGLYTLYGHLIPGSLQVKPGEYVKRGRVLGKCGNSGSSTGPHLHVQVQDGPSFQESWGVEAVFENVWLVRDGERTRVTEYTFLKGDIISSG